MSNTKISLKNSNLVIACPYNKTFIDEIKTIKGRWSPKDKVWTVSCSEGTFRTAIKVAKIIAKVFKEVPEVEGDFLDGNVHIKLKVLEDVQSVESLCNFYWGKTCLGSVDVDSCFYPTGVSISGGLNVSWSRYLRKGIMSKGSTINVVVQEKTAIENILDSNFDFEILHQTKSLVELEIEELKQKIENLEMVLRKL